MREPGRHGVLLAALILLLWMASLATVLVVRPGQLGWPGVVAAVLTRTLFHTGLFIVAHDAMHGLLLPRQPRWNNRLGALALTLYAGLPYGRCRQNHHLHHQRPATEQDPDFHGNRRSGALGWYVHFMAGYLNPRQMGVLLGGWALLALSAIGLRHGDWRLVVAQVLLGCTLPLLLSSLQLFVVGTYLPHRNQREPERAAEATSLAWPTWLSLLACYHFGYHREHHQQPSLAWFQLPEAHRRNRALAPT